MAAIDQVDFFPDDLLKKLELDKILDQVGEHAFSTSGGIEISQLVPSVSRTGILQQYELVSQFLRSIENQEAIPIAYFEDCREQFDRLRLTDYVLGPEELLNIRRLLELHRDQIEYFSQPNRKVRYKDIFDLISRVVLDKELLRIFAKIFDEEGSVKATASTDLAKIFRMIDAKSREMGQVFGSLIKKFSKLGWLTDNLESYRNGRRVLSVPSEHKRHVQGIIHDESASGKTVFIEPQAVVQLNNELVNLDAEKRREVHRILASLCRLLSPNVAQLHELHKVLVKIDVLQAICRFSFKYGGAIPKISDRPGWKIEDAYHPLLYLKNIKTGQRTVPFQLILNSSHRILLVSGPNAGGKSVFMKAVGLLQLMVQCSIPIPVRSDSEFGVLNKVFADIGDQQSLENDLSTYSSRLRSMKHFVERSDDRTLLLIDEFGSGTDPQFGGALAQSILYVLNKSGAFGIITTHYSDLKVFASKTKGLVNGAMLFDTQKIEPTYQFSMGQPGSSFAFEVAKRSGISAKIIRYAQKFSGKKVNHIDRLLLDLQREKEEVEQKVALVKERESQLTTLIRNYEELQKDLEIKRKKLKLEKKKIQLQESSHTVRQIDQIIREIRAEKDLEAARKLVGELKQGNQEKLDEIMHIGEEIREIDSIDVDDLQVGSFVRMRDSEIHGELISRGRDKGMLLVGNVQMEIALSDLIPAGKPLEINRQRSIVTDTSDTQFNFANKLDIRGMRRDEATKLLELFLDQALVANANSIYILHGKGNGILRKWVHEKLKKIKQVKEVRYANQEQGGEGVTIATL